MTAPFQVYGSPGYGSTIVEAALELLNLPYVSIDANPEGSDEERARLAAVSPMKQVPVLVTPDGQVMTESAAILIWLGDRFPEAGLAPGPEAPERAEYLRWMVFIPAAIYAMYWARDVPSRLVGEDEAAQARLLDRTAQRIKDCWSVMESQVEPAPWILGERMSLVDIYVAVVSRWTPRRVWFEQACPKLNAVVERIDALPQLVGFWPRRFPFTPGWKG
ncbi:glutathione S-transferase family protein [Brevundimonas sp. 2R-24]|uniref:Glutathione S-transferase family protein n=1 Tax=Peiella sedimenti TaxID=3061083 RepID=A0ABT8SN67_9CAUL|nr:glutathione S-transferase family protein [Caulobacteraceae bacterium XZ-24]